jgi:choline dehydrogenase-like flavoprotein
MVGGSSALNFMAWDRASKPEYDAWKELSDSEGWNWDSLLDSFRKHECADSPALDPFSAFSHSEGHVSSSGVRDPSGTSGPVKVWKDWTRLQFELGCGSDTVGQVSYNPNYTDIIPEYVKGWNTLGIPTNTNPVRFPLTQVNRTV